MIRLRRLLADNQGFTLMEILGAMILLALLIPAFIMFVDGVRMVGMSKRRNQAMNVAQQRMEKLKDADFNSQDLGTGNHTDPANPITVGGMDYTSTWDVSNVTLDGQVRQDVKRIEVTVTWHKDGNNRTTRAVTFRYEGM